MDQSYKKLWSLSDCPNLRPDLLTTIARRVHRERMRQIRQRMMWHGSLMLVALAAIVPTIEYVTSSIAGSGFGQYASLIFSDSSYMLTHWREYIFSIVDAMPITGVIVTLAVLLVLINSLRRLVQYYPSFAVRTLPLSGSMA